MVRRPRSRDLQDMLVPSIETGSSDALMEPSHANKRRDTYGDYDQASYPRRVIERRRQSPGSHHVLKISDDSPQPKRRRVVHDDPGQFRPLTSHDQMVYSAAPRAESSHLIPASSIQPRENFVQNPRNPVLLSQGLLRDTQQSLIGPSGERIPIYDAPVESGYAAAMPSRRPEFGIGPRNHRQVPGRQISPPSPLPDRIKENIFVRQPVTEDARVADRGQVVRQKEPDFSPRNQSQRPLSPCFPVSSRVPRSYDMSRTPVYGDEVFMHSSSQSRLDLSLSRSKDDINVVTERPRQYFTRQENIPSRLKDLPARSFTTIPNAQVRSPVQYMDRPV